MQLTKEEVLRYLKGVEDMSTNKRKSNCKIALAINENHGGEAELASGGTH